MKETQQKNVYAVIGMARSGTSAIARGMQALGIELGENLEAPNALWNPKGFFEDVDIVFKINRAVLFALNYTWMSVNLVDKLCKDNENLVGIKKLAIDLLKERIKHTNHWGFKDPRTAKLLPFWQEIFQSLSLKDHYIIVLRNPLSCAASYKRVSGVDIEVGLMLWLMHLLPAIDGSNGKPRIMVSYERMLKNPHGELNRIKTFFNLDDLTNPLEVDKYAKEFLDKKLHHFDYEEADLITNPACQIAPICATMYNLFSQLARDEITFQSEAFLSAWQSIKIEFEKQYPIYCYMDTILKKNKQYERQLRTIHRSLPWKLFYPLRLIDDALRKRRRKLREERRLVKSYHG